MRALTPAESWLVLAFIFGLVVTSYLVGYTVGREYAERKAHRRAARRINRAMRTLGGKS
jgi:hypothetical protein